MSYTVRSVTPGRIFISDNGDGRSITNQPEKVCAELVIRYGTRRIIYQDTAGKWDELVHKRGKFHHFLRYRGPVPQK